MRTSPLGMAVKAVDAVRQMIIPIIAIIFGTQNFGMSVGVTVAIAAAALIATIGAQWLIWTRLQYFTGETDIRVESGLLSLAKRSVPFERIQDVSLKQQLIPRLFGLVEVKFETGAGGKDELHLAYVTDEEGARLRELVRERQDEVVESAQGEGGSPETVARRDDGRDLFAMGPGRVFTFGLFEFSLVVLAALLGAAQQFDFLLKFDIWDDEIWRGVAGQGEAQLQSIGRAGQLLGALAGLIGLIGIGIATGVLRTALREWDFRLTRTAKGFRRRRGLLTKTDVLMPVHRVQAARLGTGLIRRLFGWHSLNFVSLAQDSGSANHAVAPFAKRSEIDPIASEAGIDLSMEELEWLRPAKRYWLDRTAITALIAAVVAVGLTIAGRPIIGVTIFASICLVAVAINWLAYLRHRYARKGGQLYLRGGLLTPQFTVAPQIRLQSVEIVQGPLAKLGHYGEIHFGLPGGKMNIRGISLDDAKTLRSAILSQISQVDYSRLSSPRTLA